MLSESPWFSLLSMALATVLVVILAYWSTRRLAGSGRMQTLGLWQRDEKLTVLTQTQVGKDQRLAVVQAGERFFLVGMTPQSISLLAELSKEESRHWLRPEQGQESCPQTSAFQQVLNDLKMRKQR